MAYVKPLKGGFYTKNSDKQAVFDNFVKNSTIIKIANGSFGIVFKCTLKDPDSITDPNMNYWQLNTRAIVQHTTANDSDLDWENMEKVTSICIKLGFVCSKPITVPVNEPNMKTLRSTREGSIKNEIDVQNAIAHATNDNFEPICPYIMFNKIYKKSKEIEDIFELLSNASNNKTQLEMMDAYIFRNNHRLETDETKTPLIFVSIIAMELLESKDPMRPAKSLYDMTNDYFTKRRECIELQKTRSLTQEKMSELTNLFTNSVEKYIYMFFHEIIRCAISSKIINIDLHRKNVLCIPDYKYYNDIDGKIELIDFGQTIVIIVEREYRILKQYYDNKEYLRVLLMIASILYFQAEDEAEKAKDEATVKPTRHLNTYLHIKDYISYLLHPGNLVTYDDLVTEDGDDLDKLIIHFQENAYNFVSTSLSAHLPSTAQSRWPEQTPLSILHQQITNRFDERSDYIQQLETNTPQYNKLKQKIIKYNDEYLLKLKQSVQQSVQEPVHQPELVKKKYVFSWLTWLCTSSAVDDIVPQTQRAGNKTKTHKYNVKITKRHKRKKRRSNKRKSQKIM